MKAIALALRLAGLIVVHLICFILLSAALLPRPAEEFTTAETGAIMTGVLVLSFLNTSVLSFIISRSRYRGWKLVLAIAVVLYGVMTVLPQLETAFFVKLPSGMLAGLFLFGAVFAIVFSIFAVIILGKLKSAPIINESRLEMPARQWLVRVCITVLVYLVLYFTFGYFIAWKSEAVRAYYGGNDPGSFLAQIRNVWRDTPLLFPLQVVRALLWTSIAVLVIQIMKGRWWEAGLAVALLFSVMSAQLLLPNPFMPAEVRMVHLLETSTSNFIFGWLVVLVLLDWKSWTDDKGAANKVVRRPSC
jgi:hypothetical protein